MWGGLALGRRVCIGVLLCTVVLLAGCRGGGKRAPETSDAVPTVASTSGPLAGIPIPTQTPAEPPAQSAQPEPSASPAPPQPPEGAQLARVVIPKAKVDNRVVVKGLNERREMEDPGGKDDLAWYNFSALPGFGSNAVFSGHVDWYTGDRGVFWYLRDLKEGDEAQVHYSDGTVISYRVTHVEVFGANSAPVAEITGPSSTDRLTMITCDGVFQRSSQDYTQRRVVVAERV